MSIKVDGNWKDEAAKEKDKLKEQFRQEADKQNSQVPDANFLGFVSGLAAQAMMNLGEIENAVTGQKEVNLPMAKYTIDILGIIEEKTKGNLTDDEKKYLDSSLYQLRMMFVNKTGSASAPEADTQQK